MYDHFYRCIDKNKRIYTAVKILHKKNLRTESKRLLESEIMFYKTGMQCMLLPKIKKIYEDQIYVYLTFEYFHGTDLQKIVMQSNLEEFAIVTLTFHLLKGLKQIHGLNLIHGNLKLDNIIFSSSKRDNEIFLINPKFSED